MVADTNLATMEDDVLLPSRDGVISVIAREGTSWGTPVEGELLGSIDETISLSDAGGCAFRTSTNGPTTADEYVVQLDGTVFSAAARGRRHAGIPG